MDLDQEEINNRHTHSSSGMIGGVIQSNHRKRQTSMRSEKERKAPREEQDGAKEEERKAVEKDFREYAIHAE